MEGTSTDNEDLFPEVEAFVKKFGVAPPRSSALGYRLFKYMQAKGTTKKEL